MNAVQGSGRGNEGGAGRQPEPRLAELLGALSLACDLGAGVAPDTTLRVCLLATGLARAAGLNDGALCDVFYTALLKLIGYPAFAHETAWKLGAGDELAFLGATAAGDPTRPAELAQAVLGALPARTSLFRRGVAAARLLANPLVQKRMAEAHCDLAVRLANKLRLRPGVVVALGQIYERWDGRGQPHGLRADTVSRAARIVHFAFDLVVHTARGGPAGAVEVARTRRGRAYEPALVDLFLSHAEELLAPLLAGPPWERFLAAEPAPFQRLHGAVADVAQVFACYADVKSPFTLGHSTGVARLAPAAARLYGLGPAEVERLRLAALLHDLGRVGVPNGLWDQRGQLQPGDWERVRKHVDHTALVLARSPHLATLLPLAVSDHERPVGGGYPSGSGALDPSQLILSATDVFIALREPRAHRLEMPYAQAARQLAADRSLDPRAVEVVLAAAAQAVRERPRGLEQAGLVDAEVDTLVLLARGTPPRAIARQLGTSPRRVRGHLAQIFEKTGVTARPAAAIYAVVGGLVIQ